MFAAFDLAKVARAGALGIAATLLVAVSAWAQNDPLPSWNDTAPKAAIVEFVKKVTTENSPDFVPEPERIAVFDNDGTLWTEHPMYAQLAFALDRVKAEAASHPEWKDTQPFKAVLEGDMKTLAAAGEKGLMELLMATHAGMTSDEFQTIVTDWIATARDPQFKKPYTELVYQPMLELLAYLRANGFKTFIVSGGGIEFMRPWTEKVYGVPPEQVVGSSIKTQFEMRDGTPTLMRLPQVNFIDDKAGKPVGINEHIGRRPIAAFGNSDGDLEMLQWTTVGRQTPFRPDRPPHGCRARIRLRPEYGVRPPRQGARCGRRQPMDRRRHEGRLEADISREVEVATDVCQNAESGFVLTEMRGVRAGVGLSAILRVVFSFATLFVTAQAFAAEGAPAVPVDPRISIHDGFVRRGEMRIMPRQPGVSIC